MTARFLSAWAICSWRAAKIGKVLSSTSRLEFCSQGAAWAMFRPSWRDRAAIWLASRSPTLPDSTRQDGLARASFRAVRTLAAVPSVSSARCATGRPRMPPRALMSCQAAREPIRKSLDTSCCASGEIHQLGHRQAARGRCRLARLRPAGGGRGGARRQQAGAPQPMAAIQRGGGRSHICFSVSLDHEPECYEINSYHALAACAKGINES